ncbi:MAG: glutamine synthetase III [Calditrichaeota bacterium]|nr:glutamine synthetase III [Calditrichota bacterium]
MRSTRLNALKTVLSRPKVETKRKETVSSFFGQNVFSLDTMKRTLSTDTYKKVVAAIHRGNKIDEDTANMVAASMKNWAMERGATHVTHWFQPMTGSTAEKHDSFIDIQSDGTVIERFSGKTLVQQEPDASSFPSGGLRQTFEARGYSAWDPSSPAFIIEAGGAVTLCIPSIFISYSGEALDKKTPLLLSIEALDKAATAICNYFDKNVKQVYATLGAEQEYFLIDRAFYHSRPDLMAAGRTVFGASAAKGQQLDDHYFGSIKERAFAFMNDVETEAYKLGIPLKTRHNEVAPHQFEFAPVFEEANMAVDHNLLLMDIMRKIAVRHNLAVLFHEKPFAGINGSGKHNNWSLSTNRGRNLLTPGDSPQDNLQFLIFLSAILKAVHDFAPLVRASIANSGNDHRLGANEAPPAIISVFLGEQLTGVLDNIEKGVVKEGLSSRQMSFGISKIPDLTKDATDRNRTSPFAFTGNKFELRAVGSSENNSYPISVLNTIVADTLVLAKQKIDKEINAGKDKKTAMLKVVKEFIKQSKKIRFEGDGYSGDWVKEAEKRGLPNLRTSPAAHEALRDKKNIDLFARHGVLTAREMESRYHIKMERFINDIDIEAKIAVNLAQTKILPAALDYQLLIIQSVEGIEAVLGDKAGTKTQKEMLIEINDLINSIRTKQNKLSKLLLEGDQIDDITKQANFYNDKVKKAMEGLREDVDQLETIVDDEMWPLPKYSEMLFLM